MGKSQIFPEKYLTPSGESQIPIFIKSQIFRVKSQIVDENKSANGFSTRSRHSDILCTTF